MKISNLLVAAAMALSSFGVFSASVTKKNYDEITGNDDIVVDVDLSGISGRADTNTVNGLIGEYDRTNLTGRIDRKRDKTDLKVYRKVKDCWTWKNWNNPQEPLSREAPEDFLAFANSPGSDPIFFKNNAWWGAVQFWPNGKVKYSQANIPPAGTGEFSTRLNFAMFAYDETGTNEIYRFGATATREDATNDTVVAWDETRNQYVRIATTDMVDESVKRGMTAKDGAARALPPYLHYMPFDDVYTNDAAWYYEQSATNYVHGSCSARRVGGILERNYDWEFDRAPEFVIPVSGSDTRFASVGIANVGRLITEDFVTSGKWSRNYRCLPGHTLDGVNENGVVAEINVVGGDPFEDGWTNDVANGIHPLGAVRWALDNGTSAGMAASNLSVRVKFPAGWSQNFHYMIADSEQTWIVENGAAHLVGDASVSAVMTNFRLYPTHDTYGDGQERYAILSNPANAITDAWFTRCYKRETTPPWTSDLMGLLAYTNAIYDAWATHDREFFRDMAIDGKRWWQTVHTAIYDFEAKTLKICVQEGADWYVFAVGGSGRVKSVNGKVGHVTLGPDEVNALPDDEERLVANSNFSAAVERVSPPVELPENWALSNVTNENGEAADRLLDAKRDKTDFAAGWSASGSGAEGHDVDVVEYVIKGDEGEDIFDYSLKIDGIEVSATRQSSIRRDEIDWSSDIVEGPKFGIITKRDTLAKTSEVASSIAVHHDSTKQDALTSAQMANIDAVPKKADELGEFIPHDVPSGVVLIGQPTHNDYVWTWYCEDSDYSFDAQFTSEDDDNLSFFETGGDYRRFTAARKRVLRTGDAATTNDLTAAISTNNPAFVSAVRDTPPDEDTPWGTYGTLGAAIAGIIAVLANKLTKGLDAQGVPTDANVAELFSESATSTTANPDLNNKVLKASVNKLIDAKVGSIDDALDALNGEVA